MVAVVAGRDSSRWGASRAKDANFGTCRVANFSFLVRVLSVGRVSSKGRKFRHVPRCQFFLFGARSKCRTRLKQRTHISARAALPIFLFSFCHCGQTSWVAFVENLFDQEKKNNRNRCIIANRWRDRWLP